MAPRARPTRVDRAVVLRLRSRLDEAARRIGEEFGLHVDVGRITYDDQGAKAVIEAAVIRDDGVVMDKHARDFEDRCFEFGLDPLDLGRTFTCGADTYRVLGLRPRARSPVICERVGGGERLRVALSAEFAREHLRRAFPLPGRLRIVPGEDAAGAE